MSTWGKLAGASAGYFIGGIIGAVVGAVAGHYVIDKEDEDDTDDEMEEIIDYEIDDTKSIGEEDIQFDTSSCKLNNQYSLNEWPTINDEEIVYIEEKITNKRAKILNIINESL